MKLTTYIKKDMPALLAGIAVSYFIYFVNELFSNLLISGEIIKVNDMGLRLAGGDWHPILVISTLLTTLLYILPGYTSGWLTRQNGTINGLSVTAISHITQFVIFSIKWGFYAVNLPTFLIMLQSLLLPLSVGAVSGAAGQFHRNSKLNR